MMFEGKFVFPVFASFLILTAFAGFSEAKTIYVPDDYENIQWAWIMQPLYVICNSFTVSSPFLLIVIYIVSFARFLGSAQLLFSINAYL